MTDSGVDDNVFDSEVEENLFAEGDAKLHGEMCKQLFHYICKVSEIFPGLEGTRPGSKTGIQALCNLHVNIEKAADLLQYCSNTSKFYLALTGNSVLKKFEKTMKTLRENLIRFESIIPRVIFSKVLEIANELKDMKLTLNKSEQETGEEIKNLLTKSGNLNADDELRIFCRIGLNLGITSSTQALTERRALKKLLFESRWNEDNQMEANVSLLLGLMRKYSKAFGAELSVASDDMDFVAGINSSRITDDTLLSIRKQALMKRRSYSMGPSRMQRSGGNIPIPPQEFRCPLSTQVMQDPVVISNGHCFEREYIKKWFADGNDTCPKTKQKLSNLTLIPNHCIKALIESWFEQHVDPYTEMFNRVRKPGKVSKKSAPSEIKSVEVEDRGCSEENPECSSSGVVPSEDKFEKLENFLSMLVKGGSVKENQIVVEKIRFLLKDDEESRVYMGSHGLSEALLGFLKLAIEEKDKPAQEIGAMALFNLAVNNTRNKETMLSIGVIPLLEEMISNSGDEASAAALYFTLSLIDEAKPIIGESKVLPFLVKLLHAEESKNQCRADSIQTLYNLSTHPPNIPHLLSAGIVNALIPLIAIQSDEPEVEAITQSPWSEKSISILIKLAQTEEGKSEIASCKAIITALVFVVDVGSLVEQEYAVSCLLILCEGDPTCTHLVLQEGVIPALVSTSVNGTAKCKDKAQKLLSLFRDRRQKEPAVLLTPEAVMGLLPECLPTEEVASKEADNHRTPEKKAASKKFGKIAAMLKNKYLVR